jgi:hypothetical protein
MVEHSIHEGVARCARRYAVHVCSPSPRCALAVGRKTRCVTVMCEYIKMNVRGKCGFWHVVMQAPIRSRVGAIFIFRPIRNSYIKSLLPGPSTPRAPVCGPAPHTCILGTQDPPRATGSHYSHAPSHEECRPVRRPSRAARALAAGRATLATTWPRAVTQSAAAVLHAQRTEPHKAAAARAPPCSSRWSPPRGS